VPENSSSFTRRSLLGAFAAGAAVKAQTPHREWKPRLGVLGPYSEANLAFVREAGFNNMILGASPHSALDAATLTDAQVDKIKGAIQRSGVHISAFQVTQNHIAPDSGERARHSAYFVKAIELAGKLGVPYVGPNLATSPVGFETLFKAFGNSPFVGLQYDPSHLVWQMMDPIQTARDFADKIFDVHLKDTEIRWPILRRGGIVPVDGAEWWRFRLPGLGSIDWPAFFTVLQDVGYTGAMSVEHEDALYDPPDGEGDFSEGCKTGFRMAYRYLKQYVPV